MNDVEIMFIDYYKHLKRIISLHFVWKKRGKCTRKNRI